MLQEIKTRDIVEVIVTPVFSVQLVLNVSKPTKELRSRESIDKGSSILSAGMRHLDALEKPETAGSKKTVKFTDEHEVRGQY